MFKIGIYLHHLHLQIQDDSMAISKMDFLESSPALGLVLFDEDVVMDALNSLHACSVA